MNNKKAAIIVAVFIAVMLLIIGVIGIAEHIPIIGKPIKLIFAIVLAVFVIGFFVIIIKRGNG